MVVVVVDHSCWQSPYAPNGSQWHRGAAIVVGEQHTH